MRPLQNCQVLDSQFDAVQLVYVPLDAEDIAECLPLKAAVYIRIIKLFLNKLKEHENSLGRHCIYITVISI